MQTPLNFSLNRPLDQLPISRFTLTSLSNKRNLEGSILGGCFVVCLFVRRDFLTRTKMSLDSKTDRHRLLCLVQSIICYVHDMNILYHLQYVFKGLRNCNFGSKVVKPCPANLFLSCESLLTFLLCIVGENSAGGSVAVAVGVSDR